MAKDALDDLAAVCARYPAARAELESALGDKLMRDVLNARETISEAVERADSGESESNDTRMTP